MMQELGNKNSIRTDLVCVALLVGAVALAYGNALRGEFLFDDRTTVLANESIRSLTDWRAVFHPPADSGLGGRPVANLSFALNHVITGPSVRGFRLGNIVIHAATAVLAFLCLRRLFAKATPHATAAALATALIWAVHPAPTIAINYISQRTELLMALYYVATIYCFFRATDGGSRAWAVAGAMTCAAGMACKEVMVTAPIAIFAIDVAVVSGSARSALRRHWKLHLAHALSWVLLAYLMADLSRRAVGFTGVAQPTAYGLTQISGIATYARLAVWPHPLIFDRGAALADFGLPVVIVVLVVLGSATAATIVAVRRRSMPALLCALYFLILLPTSSIVPIVHSPVAENRLYLPLLALVGAAVVSLARFTSVHRPLLCGLLVAEIGLTAHRNEDYSSATSLWGSTVRALPQNVRARNELALALAAQGKLDQAILQLDMAAAVSPTTLETHVNLSDLHMQAGRWDEALQHGNRALDLDPTSVAAHNNVALALSRTGRLEEALSHFSEAVRLNPELDEVRNNFAVALYRSGRTNEAIEQWREILRRHPGFGPAATNLAAVGAVTAP